MGKLLILIAVIMILLIGCSSAIAGKAFNQLLPEQKQFYWKCLNTDGCSTLLKNKQYAAYRTCALNCNEKASNYSLSQGWCKDSDNGVDYLIKGIITTNLEPAGKEDYCNTFSDGKEYLMEGACSGNKYIYYQKDCKEIGAKYQCGLGVCFLPNQAPVLNPIGDKVVNEGEELSFEVVATDENGDDLTYSAEGLPEGATFSDDVFSWTPTYEQAGTYEVKFKVSDGELGDEEKISLIVNPATTVKGIISGNTIWTLKNSPYIVIGHVLVEEGVSLTIEPGVVVKFDGPYYLRIDGTLVADGTEEQKIVFTSNKKNPAPGDWDKIKFTDTSTDWDGEKGSVIRNAILEYGGAGYGDQSITIGINSASPLIESNDISNYFGHGIYVTSLSSSPIIKKNTLSNGMANSGGFAISVEGNSEVSKNQIINNKISGIDIGNGFSLINNNYIFNNGGFGIMVGVSSSSCAPIIKDNTILSNTGGGIEAGGGSKVLNNTVSNNGGAGIKLGGGSSNCYDKVDLIGNSISGNNNGLYLNYANINAIKNNTITNNNKGIVIVTFYPTSFSNNNIYDNSEYAVYLQKPISNPTPANSIIIAQDNWWGTTDTSVINEQIYDFYDNFDFQKVIYEPIATKPFEIN